MEANAVMALAPKGEEVSLKTLKKKEIDKIMRAVTDGKQAANDYYKSSIEPKILEREEIYNATKGHYRKKFARLSEMSDWVSRDVKTSIDWIIPQVMEVFTGSDKPVSVQARNMDKTDAAKKTEMLIQYQLDTKNDYTTFCNDVWTDSLKLNYGVAKVWWKHEEEHVPMQVMISPMDYEIMNQLSNAAAAGDIEVTKIKKVDGGYYNVEYNEIRVTDNYPVIERVPPSEFRFTPDASSINDCKFVAHRKIVKGDYLKRRERDGVYENVDEALKNAGDTKYTQYDTTHNRGLSTRSYQLTDADDASKDVELYECYVDVDYNDDGIYEKLIVHTVGDSEVPLKIQVNNFKRVPFFVNCSERDPQVIFNEKAGFADVVEQQQDLKTAVIRQMIVNIARCNSPQMAFDQANVDVEALLDNEDLVPTNGMPGNLIYPISTPPMSSATMSLVDYAQNEIEAQTGSTRYNQGLDSESLNKTATGITSIMGQAEKRQKNMARLSAENFFKPIFRFLIQLNQQFGDSEQMIRVGDKNVSISSADVNVDYDLVLNVAQGAGTKEARINYLMVLINQIYPVFAQQGIVDENSWYVAGKTLLEEMGLTNAEKTLIDPTSEQFKQAQAQRQQSQLAMMQAQQQAEIAAKKALVDAKAAADIRKSGIPKVSAGLNDLPPDAIAEILKKMNLPASPRGMALRRPNG